MNKAVKEKIRIPPIVQPYSGQENLRIIKDTAYLTRNDIPQTFDVYYPVDFVPYKHAAVLFVNGGGPIKQNQKEYLCFTSWGEYAALNSVVGIVFNWRSGKYGDVDAMLAYLFENAGKIGIDTNNICVFPLCRGVSGTVKCILKYPAINRIVLYYGRISKAITIKGRKNMSFLIVMAQNDIHFNPDCNDWFIDEAKENTNQCEKIVHSTGVHGFDFINYNEESRYIIESTIKFIRTGEYS